MKLSFKDYYTFSTTKINPVNYSRLEFFKISTTFVAGLCDSTAFLSSDLD